MAETAALKLGNVISSSISGSFAGLAAGMRGALSEGVGFQTVSGALSRGFTRIEKAEKARERTRQDEASRDRGFAEERDNEKRKFDQIFMAVVKGMAINVEEIQKDVRKILEILSEKSILDKLGDFLKGLALAIPAALSGIFDEIIKFFSSVPAKFASVIDDIVNFFKALPSKIGSAIDDIIRFFSQLPSRINGAIDNIIRFFSDLPNRIGSAVDNIGRFFRNLASQFDDLINKYFPSTRAAISKFFSDLADIFKFDKIKGFFNTQFENLKKLFNFDDIFKAIGTKLDNLVKLLGESDIAKAFRRIRNVFAISFAQYADELDDLFNNKMMKSLGDMKVSMGGMGERIMTAIDGAVDSLKQSRLVTFGEEFGGKIMSFFDESVTAAKSTRLGTLADDIMKIGVGIFTDIGSLLKTSLRAVTPDVTDLKTFFTLGKESLNLDELKFIMSEGGVVQQGATLVGKFFGDVGRMFDDVVKLLKPIGEFFTGNNLLGKLAGFDDLMGLFGKLGTIAKGGLKYVPVVGQIIMAIEGLFAAFDTEQIAADLNKQVADVNWKDRLYALFGGILGSVAGLGDLVLMAINGIFDTNFKTDGPESLQGRVRSYFTQFFADIGSIIGSSFTLLKGLITFDKATIDRASEDISRVFTGMISDLSDVLARYVSDPAKKIYNAAIGLMEGVSNWLVDGINKLIAMAVDALPTSFSTRWGTVELVSQETKDSWKKSLSLDRVDMSGAKADTTPAVMGDRGQSAAETARLGRSGTKTSTPATPSGPATGNAPPVSSEAAKMMDRQGARYSYTESDLKNLGLNIKEGASGIVQKPGAHISPTTINGAQWVQANVSGARFTGFNDNYHVEKAPMSSHTRGLAFDMTIPANIAQNDKARQSVAKSISNATGSWVKDEYAEDSAHKTGGHFHVDFTKAKGVDNGQGTFGGGPAVDWTQAVGDSDVKFTRQSRPPEPSDSSPYAYDSRSDENGVGFTPMVPDLVDPRAEENGVTVSGGRNKTVVVIDDNATMEELRRQNELLRRIIETSNGQNTLTTKNGVIIRDHLDESRKQTTIANRTLEVQKKRDEYQEERDRLQEEFNGELKGIFRPLVQGILGPAGQASQQSEKQGGRNIVGTYLSDDFKRLGVKIFGKDQGAAIGETFQKLAGVYMDEFIDKALAPALGMESKYLNRSINTFLEGYNKTQPQIKQLETTISNTKVELEKYKKEKGDITTADIIRAGARKGFTADEKTRLTEINRLNAIIKQNEEQLDKVRATRKEYKTAALGDLFYGMTGIPTTPRNAIESIYGNKGAEGLVEDLASIFGAPFAGLFKSTPMGSTQAGNAQGAVAQEVQARRQVNAEQVQQTREVNAQNVQAQVQMHETVLNAQGGLFQGFMSGLSNIFSAGANLFRDAVGSVNLGTVKGSDMDIFTQIAGEVAGGVVKDVVKDVVKSEGGSGTDIPGLQMFDDGSSIQTFDDGSTLVTDSEGKISSTPSPYLLGSGRKTISLDSLKNLGSMTLNPANAMARVGNFAQNYIGNMITGKISNMLGGGFAGQIGGSLVKDFAMSAFRGGEFNFFQSLGSNFGVKLGPGATMNDFLGGFSKMGGTMMMNLGSTVSSLGANVGSQFLTELGAGVVQSGAGAAFGSGATTAMNIGQGLGAVGQVLGPAMMAYNLSSMIGGEYKTGLPINEIAALASLIPGVGPIAGLVGGLVNRAFGMGPKKVRATRVVGDLKFNASNLRTEQDWKKKGGWFRSNKYGTDVTNFAQQDTDAVNEAIGGIYDNLKTVTDGLKLDITQAYNFTKSIRMDMTGLSAEQQQQKWQETFQAFNDEMYKFTFGAPLEAARKVKKDAQGKEVVDEQGNKVLESYEETLLRLGQVDQIFNKAMRSILEISGKNIDTLFTRVTGQLDNATKILVADMKDAYIEAAGGIQKLLEVENEYVNLFYTEEEKRTQAIKDAGRAVNAAIANTGISTAQFSTESFGTTAQLQSQTLEDFMETQRKRYRGMIEDYERAYGWKLSSGDEKLVREYSETINKLKDAGSDFLTAGKLSWEAAQANKANTAPSVTMTTRTVGQGPSAGGELSMGGTSLAVSTTPALGNNTISTSGVTESIQTSTQNALPQTSNAIVTEGSNVSTLVTPVSESTRGMIVESIEDLNTRSSEDRQTFYNNMVSSGRVDRQTLDTLIKENGKIRSGWFGRRSPESADDWIQGRRRRSGLFGGFFGLAEGGRYSPNKPYLVGEVGPEIVVPNRGGTVISTDEIIKAVQSASDLDSKTRNLLQNAAPVSNPVPAMYMMQQALNTALNAEREILTSINNSVVNQTVNNVSSPKTNIISQGTGGVRSDNPITGAFTRSMTRGRMF